MVWYHHTYQVECKHPSSTPSLQAHPQPTVVVVPYGTIPYLALLATRTTYYGSLEWSCDGVFLRTSSSAGFSSLQNLLYSHNVCFP